MKSLFILLLLIASTTIKAQLVSYAPMNANFDQEITIQFNLNLAQGDKVKQLLGKTEGLYIWAGAGTSLSNAFEFTPKTQTNFHALVQNGSLKSLGGNRWEITMNPQIYFNVPTSKKIVVLAFIIKNADGTAQTEDILLQKANLKKLSDVTVVAKKPLIEQQIDKTVINVQADINAVGSSAFELLQKAPGISITGEDVIGMSGKAGVNVLIDGRPTQMSSKELANFLRSLPGSSIEKIELITNPSSKYDAQGNAGIINIRLKKNKIKGTNGSANLGYTQNTHYRSNASFNINHRQNKVNSFANISVDDNLQHTTGFINRKVNVGSSTKTFLNNTLDIDKGRHYNFRTGVDFYANKKSTLGILINGTIDRSPFNTPGNTLISSNGIVDSSLQTTNDNKNKNNRLNGNLNYKYEDTAGNELNIDADYTKFNNGNRTNLATTYLNNNNIKYNYTANNLDVATTIDIYAIKADYTKQWKKINAKLDAGAKWSAVNTSNDLLVSNLMGGNMKPDTGRTNMFTYKENIAAGYISFSKRYKKLEYQLGLRVEHTMVNGRSVDLRNIQINNPDTSYTNIFPTAFLSYKVNENNQLTASYSKRINRPDYQSLNPFETIYDIYTSEKGNPYLRPQYTNNLELKYTYKYALNIALGYNHTKDYSQTITTQKGQLTTATNDNIGSLDNMYLNIGTPLPINKWWDGYVNVTGFMNHYKGQLPDGTLNEKVVGLNYYIQQNFKLGKGWNAQFSSWFNAGTKEAIFKTKWLGSFDLGIKKSILNNKLTVRLGIIDIFNTQRWHQTVQFGNMDFTYQRKWESRGVRLQLSWNFGKTKYNARERATNADAERIKANRAN
jgi:iron complex outermembrane recepter protein